MKIHLYCEECGSGFPMILLHGNGENHEYFSHQLEFFKNSYRVLAPDTRGHGKSPMGEGDFSLSKFADDLYDFMTEKNIKKAILLGFSDGANIALIFTLKFPSMVEKLILNGANLSPAGVKRRFQIPIKIGYSAAKFFSRKSPEAKKSAELLGLMVNEPSIIPQQLKVINIPVLVIAGTKDMIKEKHTRLIAQSIHNSKLVFLPGDHFIANKNPDAFNKAVDDFLQN